MTTTSLTWSAEQDAIFQWFATGTGHLLVRARAGTGKTTTILEAIKHAPEVSVLLAAFNKRIAEELQRRLTEQYSSAEARTLHSLGYRLVQKHWDAVTVDGRQRAKQLDEVCPPGTHWTIRKLITSLHTKGRELRPLARNGKELLDLAIEHDLLPEKWMEATGWKLERCCTIAYEAMALATQPAPWIDYADMLYLPIRLQLTDPTYDLVVIDEAQDMTGPQLDLALGMSRGRIVLVGDDRQCQPAGTLVRNNKTENVPIESLVPGDQVVTFDRKTQVFIQSGTVLETSARSYQGPLFTLTAGGKTTRCTDSHKWLVRWTNRTTTVWVTYLMRQGARYRVGQCRLFRVAATGTDGLVCGLGQRARVERADAAWILRTHTTIEDALAYEQIVAATYGLPEVCFYPPSTVKHFTQDVIDRVYNTLGDLKDSAIRCLEVHGRQLDYPFYVRNDEGRQGRQTLFITQACNLIPYYMALPIAPDNIPGFDKRDRYAVRWEPLELTSVPFNGEVHSLNIAKHHKYIADGIVTCNSIYQFRGADSNGLDRLKKQLHAQELGLKTTFRCGTTIVAAAKQIVPDFAAGAEHPGVIHEMTEPDTITVAEAGDFILSRTNAPLIPLALKFMRDRRRCRIQGKDIGKNLSNLAQKIAKAAKTETDISAFLIALDQWESKEVERAHRAERDDLIAGIHDRAETIAALAEDCATVADLIERMEYLFADEGEDMIILSTVHKAKGLEANRVFILKATLDRFKDKGPEEDNIRYVAMTRARHTLVWVTRDPQH
jgi:hypothetical protein